MNKNKVVPQVKKSASPPSQYSANTQQNFMSLHELSSVCDGQKTAPTISNIRKKYLMQSLINRLKFLIAPSTMINKVNQNWNQQHKIIECEDNEGTQRQAILSQISYRHSFWPAMQIIQAICAAVLFWAASTQLVFLPNFQNQQNKNIFSLYFKAPFCLVIIFKLIFKQILIVNQKSKLKQPKDQQEEEESKQIQIQNNSKISYEQICNNLKDIGLSVLECGICGTYLIIHALQRHPARDVIQSFVSLILFVKVWNSKRNLDSLYKYIEAKNLKNQFRIVMLFVLILGVCHLFTLILYGMTYVYPHSNWMDSANIAAANEHNWFSHYTCSIYFAITTMATVGYGDFTPVQMYQMIIVSFIQLFGTALFGYMINVVGLTVAEINKKNEQFDNHISTIHKLQNHYQISRQLCQKFKQEIVKNESIKKQIPLSENEQVQFFKMIQSSLKQQFILQTNIKVIKKSIFFLTHFTVNFQNQIALKLIRKIYKKNQSIPLVEYDGQNSQRCMLIINSGSVDIDIGNQSSNMQMKKFIKNISPQQGKPTLNVFGYSALILNRDIDLKATTKQTSVIYLLKKKDVLECMDKNMLDFQGIAQLRERMLQYKNVNCIQAPSMMDIQKHYVPNVFFVNKKKVTVCQSRQTDYKRTDRKSKIKLITLKNYQYRTMMCIDLDQEEQIKSESRRMEKSKDQYENGNEFNISIEKIQQNQDPLQNHEATFVTKMEQVKDYENFMKKSNIRKLIPKYHEYLRGIRKHKKIINNMQKILNNPPTIRNQTARILTFTEGMNKKSPKAQN